MSTISFLLQNPQNVINLQDLHSKIFGNPQFSTVIYACIKADGKISAFKLCCEEDLAMLKTICGNNPISLLYAPKPSLNIKNSYENPANIEKYDSNIDFLILDNYGANDGDDIPMGSSIRRF